MEDYLTIPEFAKQAGCTKQYLYNQLTRKFAVYYKEENGIKYLHRDALLLVKPKSELNSQFTGELYHNELILTLKRQVDLQAKQIEQLNEALRAEQLLHAKTQERLQAAVKLLEDKRAADPDHTADQEQYKGNYTADQEQQTADQAHQGTDQEQEQAQDQHQDHHTTDQEQKHQANSTAAGEAAADPGDNTRVNAAAGPEIDAHREAAAIESASAAPEKVIPFTAPEPPKKRKRSFLQWLFQL